MQLFYFLLSLRILTVKKNNTGYFVDLNISLAFNSNVAATLLVTWLEFSIEFNKIFNITLKIFVLISNKVTWIVTWESLERFTVHVSLRVYALHCMQCLFIKRELRKFLKVVYTVNKNSPLKQRGEVKSISHVWILFFHVFEQKVLMSEFCFTCFVYCYYWSWVVGTANINFVLTMQRKLLHSISPPLCWGIQLSVSNFEKGGLGNLKSSYHKYMHGVLTMLLVKKDFLI